MNYIRKNWFEILVIGGVIIVLVGIAILGFVSCENERTANFECLKAGYREALLQKKTWFCAKKEYGTDIVVPLDDIKTE